MKRILTLLVVLVLVGCGNPSEQSDFQIVIFDDSMCKNPTYTIELEEKSVVIKGGQVGREDTGIGANIESQINITPLPGKDGWVTYVLKAAYTNCGELVSQERKVKSGWYIYEFIRDEKVEHNVRARW